MFHQRGKLYIVSHWKKIQRHHKRNSEAGSGGIDIYKFKLKMANTLSVMTNVLRNVVSKQRIRYKEKGFNLDLAYICDNIIAMGYPADNIESIFRNRLEDVYKFLEENHHDHYKIYNLCQERSYDINKFHGRVAVFPFEDHNPPTIELIQKFCDDVDTWLKANSLNVAAVHCKAGKGRTGTMICCYLLYSGQQSTAEDALACYDEKRTKDRKGVTIPSQRRYVQYFSKLIRAGLPYERRNLQLCEIRFTEANLLHSQGTVHCAISVLQDTLCAVKVQPLLNLLIDFRKSFILDIKNPLLVAGDIKVELTYKTSRKKIFHFWFNTFFVRDSAVIEATSDEERLVYTLNKYEIDDAHKDKCFSDDFKVQLVFYSDCSGARSQTSNRISNHKTSQDSRLTQSNYMLPNNSNSGSDLNYICNQKSSSSATVSSLSVAGGESSGFDSSKKGQRINLGDSAQLIYNSCTERDATSGVPAPPLPLSSPAFYSCFDEVGANFQQHSKSNNLQQNQQHFVKTAVAATSTPNHKHPHKTTHAYPIAQRQQQQLYQPSASVLKVSRDTNSNPNTSVQSNPQTHPNHVSNSSKSSKSSSISSHSSSSATGDNEEDWESATPVAKLPSFVCDSANYVLLPSVKEVHSHTNKYRTISNGVSLPKNCPRNNHTSLENENVTAQPQELVLPSNSSVVLSRQQSNLPLSSAHGHNAEEVISKNLKPRPRRETT